MADAVTEAAAALKRAEATVERRRRELADAIAEAVRRGEMLSRVAVRAGYTREHVRRLVRERGVEPRDPDRTPPPGRRRGGVAGPYSDLFGGGE